MESGLDRAVSVVHAAEVHVFEHVRRAWTALRIKPLIGARGMLRLAAAQQKRATGDERRIELVTALRVFAIHMETEIANFFTRAPFQQHAAAGASLRLEGRKLHGGGRLNRRNRRRHIVRRVRIAGRRAYRWRY